MRRCPALFSGGSPRNCLAPREIRCKDERVVQVIHRDRGCCPNGTILWKSDSPVSSLDELCWYFCFVRHARRINFAPYKHFLLRKPIFCSSFSEAYSKVRGCRLCRSPYQPFGSSLASATRSRTETAWRSPSTEEDWSDAQIFLR